MIGGGVALVSVFILQGCLSLTADPFSADRTQAESGGFVCIPFLVFTPMLLSMILFNIPILFGHPFPYFVLPIISALCWFIIGSIIGLFVGRQKAEGRHTAPVKSRLLLIGAVMLSVILMIGVIISITQFLK